MNDYSKLAGAFMQHRPQNGGIVPPHMQQQRPMQQPMGGMGRPPMQRPMGQMPGGVPGPGGIMDGQPRPQMGGMQPQRPNLGFGPAPRPLGGGIMGGQPQAPRPFQQPMNPPMGRRPY